MKNLQQLGRMFGMLLVAVVLLATTVACDNLFGDDDDDAEDIGYFGETLVLPAGEIADWDFIEPVTVRIWTGATLEQTSIDENGSFPRMRTGAPSTDDLQELAVLQDERLKALTTSNAEARFRIASILVFESGETTPTGSITRRNTEYWYVDRATTVSGTRDSTSGDRAFKHNYDLEMRPGWNRVVIVGTETLDSETTRLDWRVTTEPEDANWRYRAFPDK